MGLRQGVPGLLEQADLLAVEQLDLEPGGAAAETEGGPCEQVGPPGTAGPFGRLAEPGPAGERVCQLASWDGGQLSQDVPAEARAQDGSRSQYRTGRLRQLGQPRAGDDQNRVGDEHTGLVGACFPAGEVAGQFGDQQGAAAAALGYDPDQVRHSGRPAHSGQQAGHVVFAEGRQRDHQAGPQQRGALGQPTLPGPVALARGDQHGHGHGPQRGSQLGQQPQRHRVGLMRVVDDHDYRPACGCSRHELGQVKGQLGPRPLRVSRAQAKVASRVGQRGQKRRAGHEPRRGRMARRQRAHYPRPRAQRGAARGGGAPRPDDLEIRGPVSRRLGQPGLADAGLASDGYQSTPPGARGGQHRVDLGQRPGARYERVQHRDDHPPAILPVWQNARLPQ